MPTIEIPIKLVSEANVKQHWAIKHKRAKVQEMLIKYEMRGMKIPLPCTVTLIKCGGRRMDYDNLLYAFKKIRDTIADQLIPNLAAGRADDSELITWIYKQDLKAKKCIRVEISRVI